MATSSGRTLYDKVWEFHTVDILPTGQTQLFIGLHLIHEITTAPAFDMLRERGLKVAYPERTFATVDHIVPTDMRTRPFLDSQAEELTRLLENNTRQFGIDFYGVDSDRQGIVHVIGPQLGLTQPGMTLACGDSHTSTHGAFGTLAFGIGTSQVRDVLATQTLAIDKLKVRRINVNGKLAGGVYAKDVILSIIRKLGVAGGKGFAYEYGGAVVDNMNMEERMTVCNMSIEGGALVGYVNPDETTFDYLKGRPFVPQGKGFDRAVAYWKSVTSDQGARYGDVVDLNGAEIEPTVTWGINPGQAVGISEKLPDLSGHSDAAGHGCPSPAMGTSPRSPGGVHSGAVRRARGDADKRVRRHAQDCAGAASAAARHATLRHHELQSVKQSGTAGGAGRGTTNSDDSVRRWPSDRDTHTDDHASALGVSSGHRRGLDCTVGPVSNDAAPARSGSRRRQHEGFVDHSG